MPKSADKPFKWTEQSERALALVFEGRKTQDEIVKALEAEFSSDKFHISTRALRGWITHPDFQARLNELLADFRIATQAITFANKGRRIAGLNHVAMIALGELEDHTHLIEERPTRDGVMTNEAFNNTASSEFRAALADIAAEFGDRKNVTELTGAMKVAHGLDTDDPEAAAYARALIRRVSARGASDASGPGVSGE